MMGIFLILSTLSFSTAVADTRRAPETVIGSIEDAGNRKRFPKKIGNWKKPPDIIICGGAPVGVERVESALSWWSDRGYEFGTVREKRELDPCREAGSDGVITIELADNTFDQNYLAITLIKTVTERGEILSARIIMIGDGERERILEHEIGHALGYKHFNKRGHMMNSNLSEGGWNDTHIQRASD